jgi:hypothetical protein
MRFRVYETWKANLGVHPDAIWLGLERVDEPEPGKKPRLTLEVEGLGLYAWRGSGPDKLELCVPCSQVAPSGGFNAGSIVGVHLLVGDLPPESEVP